MTRNYIDALWDDVSREPSELTRVERATVYRHYKGNYYYVLALAEHTEASEILVIYHALYGEGDTFARPLEMFVEEVPEEDQKKNITGQRYRFERVLDLEKRR